MGICIIALPLVFKIWYRHMVFNVTEDLTTMDTPTTDALKELLQKLLKKSIDELVKETIDQSIEEGITKFFKKGEDLQRVINMTDEEAHQNALNDPDNPPLSEEQIKQIEASLIPKQSLGIHEEFKKHQHETFKQLKDLERHIRIRSQRSCGYLSNQDIHDFLIRGLLEADVKESFITETIHSVLLENQIECIDLLKKTRIAHHQFQKYQLFDVAQKESKVGEVVYEIREAYLKILLSYELAFKKISRKLKEVSSWKI